MNEELPAEPQPHDSPKVAPKRVLFVCLGNICRSPAAEGVLADYVRRCGVDDQILIDSAGTAGYHVGKKADPRMRAAAARRGIELTSEARLLSSRDLSHFDLVVVMDRDNYRNTLALAHGTPTGHVRMLSDFLDATEGWPQEVPDPYYGGEEGFEFVLNMLQAAMPRLTAELLGHSKPN